MGMQVCHCFGVLAEAVLVTLRGSKKALAGGTACPKADKQWHVLKDCLHKPSESNDLWRVLRP